MLVSRITQLTKDDVIEDGQATWMAIDGHRLMLPPNWRTSSASYATRASRDGHSAAWERRCHGSSLARVQRARPWTSSSESVSTAMASTPMPGATPPA